MTKKYNDIENQNIKHNADWSTFKDSLELSQEELAQIDLKVEELSLSKTYSSLDDMINDV